MKHCPRCRVDFQDQFEDCFRCRSPLEPGSVEPAPSPEAVEANAEDARASRQLVGCGLQVVTGLLAAFLLYGAWSWASDPSIELADHAAWIVYEGGRMYPFEEAGVVATAAEREALVARHGVPLPELREGAELLVYCPVAWQGAPEGEEFSRDGARPAFGAEATGDHEVAFRAGRGEQAFASVNGLEPRMVSARREEGGGVRVTVGYLATRSPGFHAQLRKYYDTHLARKRRVPFQRLAVARLRACGGPVAFDVSRSLGGEAPDVMVGAWRLLAGGIPLLYPFAMLLGTVLTAVIYLVLWPRFAH